ncbi:NADH dehydrogenase [ubiquinone] 1 alpha subcomplex assembly factor 2-like [Panonychus citri]|uniref:NADH dehydrogenase [ubiquinone] 1 alpha subcomplex assembly factor 2-like n=1 Tax=Panonychus citri TaxID=50023 RepID=UPI002306F398|nr:NADH dehydrogenase [ubiquinone] 1 alpha subcomplex assembly factor 2-like [Panonychus citri]
MSNRPGLFSIIWQQLTKIIKYQPTKEKIVGKDIYGNIFYENDKVNFRGQLSRYHCPPGNSDILNKISPEWDAWLRYRRKDPPSEAEVLKNLKISEMKKMNADNKQKEQLNKKYSFMGKSSGENIVTNEFNESFPKHKGMETVPGAEKK